VATVELISRISMGTWVSWNCRPLRELVRLVDETRARGGEYFAKFEVSSAFIKYKLHWSLVGLQAYEVDDYFVLPLVGTFD
ncbi:unnamed protein product, partial [Symbiodinium microadriaticum]